MAATKENNKALSALTLAALSLPGLFSPVIYATEGDEVDFQYSHYQEGKRDISLSSIDTTTSALYSVGSKSFNPIEVDSLHGHANVTLADRIRFAFNYTQDTWGGATPVATAPVSVGANNPIFAKSGSANLITGASPYLGSAGQQALYLDNQLNPLVKTNGIDAKTGLPIYKRGDALTHVMATASPETRKQGDFKLSYDWDNASVNVGGGISIEDDYESRFGSMGGSLDFNQKRTTLSADLSYTNSTTYATLDHDDYISSELVPKNQLYENIGGFSNWEIVHGIRQDWSSHLGLTQVLNKDAQLSLDFSYNRSTGYLNNPYKGVSVYFIDPNTQTDAPPGGYLANVTTFYERRPEVRNQWQVGGRFVQYINPLDAALHFDYRFSADDWGIQAHTFEADWVQPLGHGWTITPRIRYYSQEAADFYAPYLVSQQAYNGNALDAKGNQIWLGLNGKEYSFIVNPTTGSIGLFDANGNPAPQGVDVTNSAPKTIKFDQKKLPNNFSSDHRLSGYGTLSGGITLAKQFTRGLTLETGFEYYTHQGSLKLGGGGEGSYANFDYWAANAALKVNLDALSLPSASSVSSHAEHEHSHHAAHEPAGVMFAHLLPKAGDFMVGYRYAWNSQSGAMLHGTDSVTDSAIVNNACIEPGSIGCLLNPSAMTMHMHMLDLMYTPTDWLTLMLMPQFMDMHMDMRQLEGASDAISGTDVGGHISHHLQNSHESGGIGDLGMYALFKLFDNGMHHLHVTAGLSAPTGDVNIQLRRAHHVDGGYMDYGMQLGSGTWDFKPSLTYTGHVDEFSWGAQASGIIRMEDKNQSGYRLGDLFQATAWGGYNLTHWLTASVRGVYTVQGSIDGQFKGSEHGQFTDSSKPADSSGNLPYSSLLKFGPQDYTGNYGGRFWDVGFGLSASIPSGPFAGHRLSVEWLQPVHENVNGYQLKRDGSLSATWNVMF